MKHTPPLSRNYSRFHVFHVFHESRNLKPDKTLIRETGGLSRFTKFSRYPFPRALNVAMATADRGIQVQDEGAIEIRGPRGAARRHLGRSGDRPNQHDHRRPVPGFDGPAAVGARRAAAHGRPHCARCADGDDAGNTLRACCKISTFFWVARPE
jgi:hypothetical protein